MLDLRYIFKRLITPFYMNDQMNFTMIKLIFFCYKAVGSHIIKPPNQR